MSGQDWRGIAADADGLPYGRAKTLALEKALSLAACGGADDQDLFWLRMGLTGAYEYGGEPAKAFTTFSRCLSAFDSDPADYGPDANRQLLWQFKWVVSSLTDFPEIPLERTRAVLADMERRYREGGYSLHAVHGLRCRVARHLGDAAEADAQFELWRTAPRDDSSDCEGCVPSRMADHLAWRGQDEAAVALAEPVLSGRLHCKEQPQSILTTLVIPFLRTGRHDAAVDAHRRSYRAHRREDVHYLQSIATHLDFCAMTGNHARGLQILERHLGALDSAPSPACAMVFAASAALLLDRLAATGHGDIPVRRPGHGDRPEAEVGVTELRDTLRALARGVAARFDARNGTTAQSDRVRDHLAVEPVVDALPLAAHAPRPAGAAPAPAAPEAEPFEEDPDRLAEQAWRLWREEHRERARAAWRRFDELAADAGASDEALARRSEAEGQMRGDDGDASGAVEQWRAAADRHEAAGREADRGRVLSRIGEVLLSTGDALGLPLLEESVALLDRHGAGRERAEARLRFARALLSTGDAARALELLDGALLLEALDEGTRAWLLGTRAFALERAGAEEGVQDAALVRAREAAREAANPLLVTDAAMRHGALLRGAGPEAWEAAGSALAEAAAQDDARVPDGMRAGALLMYGHWLCDDQEHERAVAPLAEAVALLTALGETGAAAHARRPLARAYQGCERHLEAAEAAEEALAMEDEAGLDDLDRMMLRETLARSLTGLGEFADAVTRWDELIAMQDPDRSAATVAHLHDEVAQLLDRLGRDAEAAERHGAAAAVWEGLDEPFQAASQHQRRAMMLKWAGETEAALAASRLAEQWLDRAVADPGLSVPEEQAHFRRGAMRFDRARVLWGAAPHAEAESEAEAAIGLFRAAGDDEAAQQAERLLTAIRESAD